MFKYSIIWYCTAAGKINFHGHELHCSYEKNFILVRDCIYLSYARDQ
jgi:hypothetical protein